MEQKYTLIRSILKMLQGVLLHSAEHDYKKDTRTFMVYKSKKLGSEVQLVELRKTEGDNVIVSNQIVQIID